MITRITFMKFSVVFSRHKILIYLQYSTKNWSYWMFVPEIFKLYKYEIIILLGYFALYAVWLLTPSFILSVFKVRSDSSFSYMLVFHACCHCLTTTTKKSPFNSKKKKKTIKESAFLVAL